MEVEVEGGIFFVNIFLPHLINLSLYVFQFPTSVFFWIGLDWMLLRFNNLNIHLAVCYWAGLALSKTFCTPLPSLSARLYQEVPNAGATPPSGGLKGRVAPPSGVIFASAPLSHNRATLNNSSRSFILSR